MLRVLAKRSVIAMAPGFAGMAQAQDAATRAPAFVRTQTVSAANQLVTRQFFGQVAAVQTVGISFKVGGYLDYLDATEGAWIEAGTLLARLDLKPFQRAVERAELSLAQAERNLERTAALVTRNIGSKLDADNARTARDLAKVELREAREALQDGQIKAPFDALVADRLGTRFSTVARGEPVLRLHNMSELRVEFDMPERLLERTGDLADVIFTGQLSDTSAPIALNVAEFRTETDGAGHSYRISLAVSGQPAVAK